MIMQDCKSVFAHIIPTDNNLNVLKVAFYGTKSYDKIFFEELAKDKGEGAYNCEITYFDSRPTPLRLSICAGALTPCVCLSTMRRPVRWWSR